MALTDLQKSVLFGTLLGDGNLSTETNGRTWRYRALHKTAHVKYLENKYTVLQNLCASGPIYGEVFDPRTGKIYKRHYFNTLTTPSLNFYANMFYVFDYTLQKRVKVVPKNLEKNLTPCAIAYWYMDDGAIKWLNHSNAMRICTESFKKEDVTRLRQVLWEKYKIKTTQFKKTREGIYVGDRIAIPEESSAAFRDLIKAFLVDCLK
jgi:hypothetical protein